MRLPFTRLALASSLSLAVAACGGDSGANGNGNGNGNGDRPDAGEPEGEHHTYVVDQIRIPTTQNQASQFGLDLDGDSEPDNALGRLLATLGGAVEIDLQATLDEQFQDGTIIVLADLQATSLDNAQNAAFWAYLGANPSVDPCDGEDCGRHLEGDASFDVDPDSPTNARVDGTVTGGSFSGGPGNVSLSLQFIDGLDQPLNIDLVGARVEIESVSETGLSSGRIGGGITIEQINQELIPAIATGLNAIIDDQCAGEGEAPEPCGCEADSNGETVQDAFDADDNCEISDQELIENDIIATFIQADVDLLDDNGNFDPTPEDDPNYNPDSMSLGVGFSAAAATYTSPNE